MHFNVNFSNVLEFWDHQIASQLIIQLWNRTLKSALSVQSLVTSITMIGKGKTVKISRSTYVRGME